LDYKSPQALGAPRKIKNLSLKDNHEFFDFNMHTHTLRVFFRPTAVSRLNIRVFYLGGASGLSVGVASPGFFLHVAGQRFPLLGQFNITIDRRLYR
jgi:hypothetical protein